MTFASVGKTCLLNELKAGTWDGQHLDEKLLALDQEDQQHYTFYPHDPRMFLNRQGAWEASGERQITLPLGLQEELDDFKDRLRIRWSELNAPLMVGQVITLLEDLGWQRGGLASLHRCIRAWLLTTEQFRRVGEDYWIPKQLLPPKVQRTRLQVMPVRTSEANVLQATREGEDRTWMANGEQDGSRKREQFIDRGTATKTQVVWTITLRSIHLNEGFIPIPRTMRGIYPPIMPGEEDISVLKVLWYDDATDMWIWLDRVHHRLYGPDLLDKIGFFSAGVKLKVDWNHDLIVLHEVGHDPEVQQEETRLVDLEELKQLRGGLGEGCRGVAASCAINCTISAKPCTVRPCSAGI